MAKSRPAVQVGYHSTLPTDGAISRQSGVTLFAHPMRPESKGQVHITAADPRRPPAINFNFLSSPPDAELTVRAVRRKSARGAAPHERNDYKPMAMGPQVDALRLRRALRDLVALSAVPAAWVGREPSEIALGLAEVLVNSLYLDFAFVRLCNPNGGPRSKSFADPDGANFRNGCNNISQ